MFHFPPMFWVASEPIALTFVQSLRPLFPLMVKRLKEEEEQEEEQEEPVVILKLAALPGAAGENPPVPGFTMTSVTCDHVTISCDHVTSHAIT